MTEPIVGIDLGTTNSEIAIVVEGHPRVIDYEGERIMPSVIGLSPDGELLVGTAARNQMAAYPERTIRSVKRRMGSDDRIPLGDRTLTPPEVSALILKELVRRARSVTGLAVREAVITVPAFFNDAQRQATRIAGEIAGITVARIINEPTAAALAYEGVTQGERLLLVYDLGGGTFDASLVHTDGELVEVLASHGDTRLGGDDFDNLIVEEFARALEALGIPDPRHDPHHLMRLLEAAEAAKRRLTEETHTQVREEFLGEDAAGNAVHLDHELARERFHTLIRPWIERTLDSVHETMSIAGKRFADLDDVLLVGGSTRTKLIGDRLHELCGRPPRKDVHPDLCVALGAAIQGAVLAGQETGRVLVDVTPYSFGPSYVGMHDDMPSPHCYRPVIERGTPLPTTRAGAYATNVDNQETVELVIYQGESTFALDNVEIGKFKIEGLSRLPKGNSIICRMHLDLNGQLVVSAIEKCTGLSKTVTIDGATNDYDPAAVEESRKRTGELWNHDESDELAPPIPITAGQPEWKRNVLAILARAEAAAPSLAAAERDDIATLQSEANDALQRSDQSAATAIAEELEDLLHYATDSEA